MYRHRYTARLSLIWNSLYDITCAAGRVSIQTHTCLRECLLHTPQLTKSPFPSRLVHLLSFRLLGNRKWHAVSITRASEQNAASSYCAVVVDGARLEVFLPNAEARHSIAQFSYTERLSLRCPHKQLSSLHKYS